MTISQASQETQESLEIERILVTADFGGIGTKAFVSYRKGGRKSVLPLLMGAEVAVVTEDTIKSLEEDFGLNHCEAERRAWCGVPGSSYRVVGSLAEKFHGFTFLRPPKYELAIFKTLALLWVVKEKLNLPHSFNVKLGLLIPPGEYSDRFRLESLLMEACLKFCTPSGEMSVNIDFFDCIPESGGISLYFLNNPSKYNFEERNVSIVMIGYRNASMITLEQGRVGEKVSSPLGMNYMVARFVEYTGNTNPVSELVPIIANPRLSLDRCNSNLFKLIRTTFINSKDYEYDRLKQGIIKSKMEYLRVFNNWLIETLPSSSDLVVYCGGTAEYLREDLSNLSATNNLEFWFFDFLKIPQNLDKYSLHERLYDLYCYFKFMVGNEG